MSKEIKQFLFELLQTYPIYSDSDEKEVINDTSKYIEDNLKDKKVDFEKAKNLIFSKYERKSFPAPSELMNFLDKAVIVEQNPEIDDGTWYLLTLPNGRKYPFSPSSCGKSIGEYKEEWERKYGSYTLEKYTDDYIFMFNKVYTHINGKMQAVE